MRKWFPPKQRESMSEISTLLQTKRAHTVCMNNVVKLLL